MKYPFSGFDADILSVFACCCQTNRIALFKSGYATIDKFFIGFFTDRSASDCNHTFDTWHKFR